MEPDPVNLTTSFKPVRFAEWLSGHYYNLRGRPLRPLRSAAVLRRSMSEEATVFFLLAIAVAIGGNMILGKTVLGVAEAAPIVFYVVFAYLCWRRIRIVFLITPFLLVFGWGVTWVFSYQNAPAESYAIAFHALAMFFSWRAYREMKLEAKPA